MKWQVVEPTQGTFDWTGADNLVDFAEQHRQLVRGHTLVWHNQLPNWLTSGVANGTISNAQLRDLLHQHITTEVSRYKGRIWQWDVANELFTDINPVDAQPERLLDLAPRHGHHRGRVPLGAPGRSARAAVLQRLQHRRRGRQQRQVQRRLRVVKQLLAQGVPINGVGDQGHLDMQYGFSGTQMTQDLQGYASLGLKVAITEADVRTFVNDATDQMPTDHLATFAQPDEFGQMLKACLAVRQCISFTVWGFDDAESWVPGIFTGEGYADIYDVNLNPKPAYTELQQDLRLSAFGAPHRVPSGAGL